MKLYVGNIANDVSEQELQDLFSSYGSVVSARIIKDKFSGQSRGFGFVEMENDETGNAAIDGLNGSDLRGQSLRVNVARPPQERTGGFGGGERRSGGSSRGGFGGNRGGGFGGGRNRF
jgi:RNA recognition motif-containing protein